MPRLSTSKIHPLKLESHEKEVTFWDKYWNFILSPRSHFVYETVIWTLIYLHTIKMKLFTKNSYFLKFNLFLKCFFVIFLVVFSYLMMSKYRFFKPDTVQQLLKNNSILKMNGTFEKAMFKKYLASPHWLEYVIIYWVFSFVCQEVFQVFSSFNSKFSDIYITLIYIYFAFWNISKLINSYRGSLVKLFVIFAQDRWNYIDLIGCLMFIIGMLMRFLAIFMIDNDLFISSR